MIRTIGRKVENFILSQRIWLFLVIILAFSLGELIEFDHPSWYKYFLNCSSLLLIYAPLFFFELQLPKLKERFGERYYYVIWGLCYAAYILVVNILIQTYITGIVDLPIIEELYVAVGVSLFALSAILKIQPYLKQDALILSWTKRISLDHALIIIVAGLALIFGGIVVSDIEKFNAQQAVEISISLRKIIEYFPEFISISVQLFIAYMAGFFFYYVNHHFLIGKLLRKKGIFYYAMGVLGMLTIFFPLLAQLVMWLPLHQEFKVLTPSENLNPFDQLNGAAALLLTVVSIPIILVIQWFKQNNEITSLEKEKVETELSLLKQQINPHFFFNTLNNLYALSLTKSDKTPEVVMQLSELMRYVIYKGKEKEVMLKEEVKYLEDYIQLQQIRLKKSLDLSFEKEIDDDTIAVPPLLLVIFIENAFKHGIEPAEKGCYLHIKLTANSKTLKFDCTNSFEQQEVGHEGIGLENLKRRLDLIFADRYKLGTHKEEGVFKSSLKINLR